MAKAIIWQDGASLEAEFTAPAKLDDILKQHNLSVSHPCGGRGTCGKCRVTLAGHVSEPDPLERQAGNRLSCRVMLLGDAQVWLPESQPMVQIETADTIKLTALRPMAGQMGAAVDIGTTTLAVQLYDLRTGKCIGQSSRENPQRAVAADVIGRIQAALEGQGELLQKQILRELDQMLKEACESGRTSPQEVDALTVVGNTTMLYLLTGESPRSLAFAPFVAEDLFGRQEKLLGRRAYLPPCMNAFVGADITAAVLSSGMCEQEEISLLCDIGTNGELALWKDGMLYVTSTAAGPAFEGAGISCGCGSVTGAVDQVWVEEEEIRIHTIQNGTPVGICGSGLLDAIAACLELEIIDETGAMDEGIFLSKNVALLPKDVRAVQLAKAAIAAGIETVCAEAGICVDAVQTLYIAGGFGSHLNIASAVKIGLIPQVLRKQVKVLGNAALTGAAEMLLDQNLQRKAKEIAGKSKHVNLGGSKVFNELYIEKMLFA